MRFGERYQANTGILPLRSDITGASSLLSEGPGPLKEHVVRQFSLQAVSH